MTKLIYRDLLREKRMFRALVSLFAVCCPLFSFVCAAEAANVAVADLQRFPQTVATYLPMDQDTPIASYGEQEVYADEYLRAYFAPWQNADLSYLDLSLDKVVEFQRATAKKAYYTADAKLFLRERMNRIAANSVFDMEATPRPGVVLADEDVRVLPTATPLFISEASAKGARGLLKMDAMQNSTVKPGEPLAVYGATKDGAWLFIATGSVVGWVRTGKVAPVDAEFMDAYLYAPYSIFIKDNVRIRDAKGDVICTAKMGTLLPRDGMDLLLPVRGPQGIAVTRRYRPEQGTTAPFPVPFTPRNAGRAIDQLMGEPYGWGGMNGFRDCSAMTRDYFALFGIWLPRNSGDQAKTGASIPLKNIPVGERPKTIAENAVPFATLIHMPGHIMLYLGLFDGEPIVLHNVWGIRVNGPGNLSARAVIGKTVVSSLRAGAEIENRPKDSLFMDRIAALVYPMASIQ